MTIQERYDILRSQCGNRERVFQHVGVPRNDGSGGWIQRPRIDRDNGGIPLMEKFFIAPKTAQQRLDDLHTNGWAEFVPPSTPDGVKPARVAEPVAFTQTRKTRTRKSK